MFSMYWVPPSIFMIPRARMIKTRATIRAAVHPAKKPEFFFRINDQIQGKEMDIRIFHEVQSILYIYIN